MICYCCQRDVSLARRVQLRGDSAECSPGGFATPAGPADQAYVNNNGFRTAFICVGCYYVLDNDLGVGEIAGRMFNLAGQSRRGKAPAYNCEKWLGHGRQQAGKLAGDRDDQTKG
jgi:hypothetical protein